VSLKLVTCLSNSTTIANNIFRSCDFEVFGTVQHVYFRQHTQEKAKQLNLVGWVQNTAMDTVVGHMEGEKTNFEEMKMWLQKIGSPKSKITKTVFTNEKTISTLSTNTFDIRR